MLNGNISEESLSVPERADGGFTYLLAEMIASVKVEVIRSC